MHFYSKIWDLQMEVLNTDDDSYGSWFHARRKSWQLTKTRESIEQSYFKKKSNFSWKIYLILLTSYKWLDLDSLKKCIYEFFDDYNIFFKKFRWQAHQSISSGRPSILKRVKTQAKWKYPISDFLNKGPLIIKRRHQSWGRFFWYNRYFSKLYTCL